MGAVGHGLYCHLWAVRACSSQWRALIRSWATPPTSGDFQIERGDEPIQYNQPWRFDWENTLILVATGHGLYRCLWAARVCSAQWCALIRSWARHLRPATSKSSRGASPYSTINRGFLCSLAAARWQRTAQWRRQLGGDAAAVAVRRRRGWGSSLAAARQRRQSSCGSSLAVAWRWWQCSGGGSTAAAAQRWQRWCDGR
jgi:hypothetical protein